MEWNVRKPSLQCCSCGAKLEGMEFHSSLRDNGIEFDRLDFCLQCWDKVPREDFFSHWKTKRVKEEKQKARPRYVDQETMLDIFRKLAGGGSQGKEAFTFLLGMVLVQKRALRYVRSETREAGEFVVLAHARSGENFDILNPSLSEEDMNRAKENFDAILDTQGE